MPGMPLPVADERDGLLSFLRQQRDALRVSAHGLTDDEARQAPTAGVLTIGGLVKHLIDVERTWIGMVAGRPRVGGSEDYLDAFRFGPDDTLAAVFAEYDAVARQTESVIAAIADLGQAVPVPKGVPWFPDDVDAWSVRWVLLHLIEETAKHAGHADIVRESIDGATFYPLMAAVEGWPASPWLMPWQRTAVSDVTDEFAAAVPS